MLDLQGALARSGLITSGGGRDLLQVKAIDYPVFTGSTICSHAYCHILHIGLPVRVGGLVVDPGDLLHGDANGVTNIPDRHRRPTVADIAQEFVDAEKIVLDYVNGTGNKTPAGLAAAQGILGRRRQPHRPGQAEGEALGVHPGARVCDPGVANCRAAIWHPGSTGC